MDPYDDFDAGGRTNVPRDPSIHKKGITWHDVSRTPLPHALKLQIYCLYGVGLDTEGVYYYYRRNIHGSTNNHRDSITL
jgi:hypothetical protein